jgi:hypothetical protein
LLPVKIGDVVSYILAQSAGHPSAVSAKLIAFSARTQTEVETFFRTTIQNSETSLANQVRNFILLRTSLMDQAGFDLEYSKFLSNKVVSL